MKPSLLMPSECRVLERERKKKNLKKWLLIIVAVFALKILYGGPGKGGNPNEEYSAGFLCAVSTQEPQLVSQEVVERHKLTPVIPLGGQMLLPGWGGNNEDQEHPESFQASAAEEGGGCRSCPCSRFYPLPNLPTHPAKCGNTGQGGSCKRNQVEFIHLFSHEGKFCCYYKKFLASGASTEVVLYS